MRLAVLSDLHVECEGFELSPALAGADLIVLAGDIHNGVEALHWARRAFARQTIVQVAGNHEFFGGNLQQVLADLRVAAAALGIHFLENDAVVLDGVRFLGSTLWTDFALYTTPGRPLALAVDEAMASMQRRMVDFHAVRWSSAGAERLLEPADTAELHRQARDWLARQLALPHDGPTVVVTHHLPSYRSVAPAYAAAPSNVAFASDLDALVAQAALWIHGHTHHNFDYRIGAARVVANPRGYIRRDGSAENPAFDPAKIVTV